MVSLLRFVARPLALFVVFGALLGIAIQQPVAADDVALGQAAAQHLDWRRALSDFRAAATLDPNNPNAFIGMAQIWFWQHKLLDAHAAIKRAEQYAPTNPATWLLAGQIAAQAGNAADALTAWHHALRLAPQTSTGLTAATLAADTLLDQGLPEQALTLIMSLSRLTPSLQWDEALALLHRGQAGKAYAIMATIPITNPASSYRAIAAQWQGTARDEAALGFADITDGRPGLGIAPLQAAIATDAAYGSGDAYLTWALWETGQHDAARVELALAEHNAPDDPVTVGARAIIASADGQATQALATLRDWLDSHDSSPALWTIVATLAGAANDPATAADAWWRLATTAAAADRPAATVDLARFYLATGLGRGDGRAAWAIATAQALNPQDAATADLAAQWETQTGQLDQALADLRQAVARDPHLAIAHAHLGALEFRLGDLTAAAIELGHAADLDATGATTSIIGPLLAILGDSVA